MIGWVITDRKVVHGKALFFLMQTIFTLVLLVAPPVACVRLCLISYDLDNRIALLWKDVMMKARLWTKLDLRRSQSSNE